MKSIPFQYLKSVYFHYFILGTIFISLPLIFLIELLYQTITSPPVLFFLSLSLLLLWIASIPFVLKKIFSHILKKDYGRFSMTYPDKEIGYIKVFYFIALAAIFVIPLNYLRGYFGIDTLQNKFLRYFLIIISGIPGEFLALKIFLQTAYKKNPFIITEKNGEEKNIIQEQSKEGHQKRLKKIIYLCI